MLKNNFSVITRKGFLKVYFFILLFMVLAWAGMADNLSAKAVKPGVIINSENYQDYLAELKGLLDSGTLHCILEGLKKGLITMPIVERRDYPQPKYWYEYTQKYANTCKIGAHGELKGWKAGVPFPTPSSGREMAWNLDRKYQGSDQYSTKDGEWHLFNKQAELERKYVWDYWELKYNGRVRVPPLHSFPNNPFVQRKFCFRINSPFDVKGFCMIRTRFEDILRADEVYSYIPAIRRIRRLVSTDTADPMLGSDIIYDDFNLFWQKITPGMTCGIKERNMLVTSHRLAYEHNGSQMAPCRKNVFQMNWEIRPVYVFTMHPNDPDYPYSKRVVIMEKQRMVPNGYAVNTYDQSGRLYRGQWFLNTILEPPYYEPSTAGVRYDNFITGHSTVLRWKFIKAADTSVKPEIFSFNYLLRGAR